MKEFLKNIVGNDLLISYRLLKYKYFPSPIQKKTKEREKEELVQRTKFYSDLLAPGELCFDVGANVGNRVEAFLEVGANVVAVEPQEYCYKFLKRKFGKKISIETKGLSDKEETKDFYVSNYSVVSSFSKEWIDSVKGKRFGNSEWKKVVKTEMTTLDKLISKYGKPSFIKIDVEGYELEVLKGLSQAIKLISFEYTVPEQTEKAIECISQIEKLNKNIQCNYSSGESMQFSLPHWISSQEMKEFIKSEQFIKSGFGDIYVRQIN
jgi:FkbM family methyltransferase